MTYRAEPSGRTLKQMHVLPESGVRQPIETIVDVIDYPDDPLRTFPTSDPYVRRVECGAGLITYLVNDVARKVIPRHHPGREGEWLSRQSSVV